MELSPGSFRTFVVGTSYQLGNLVSSASSTIEATIGERFPLPSKHVGGKTVARYNYGIVIAICKSIEKEFRPYMHVLRLMSLQSWVASMRMLSS